MLAAAATDATPVGAFCAATGEFPQGTDRNLAPRADGNDRRQLSGSESARHPPDQRCGGSTVIVMNVLYGLAR